MLMSRLPAWTAAGAVLVLFAGVAAPAGAQPLDLGAQRKAAVRAAPKPIPLPPARPANLGGSSAASGGVIRTAAAEPVAAPVQISSAQPAPTQVARAPRQTAQLSQQEAVQRLNEYFNGFRTLQADFIQFAANGRRYEGRVYIQRPGRMRFEYQPPVTMEVVADGTSVAIRDRKLATQDLYSIGQTPLKFLVKEQMDLARDSTITGVSQKGDTLSVRLEDRSTLGGTSKITLNFDLAANELKQWVVIDPQGYETSVALYNLDTQRRPDPKNFVINYERML